MEKTGLSKYFDNIRIDPSGGRLFLIASIVIPIILILLSIYGLIYSIESKEQFENLHNIFEIGTILFASAWFLITAQFHQRIAFDIDCKFASVIGKERLVEIQFLFENKGFVEHRLWNLQCSVDTIDPAAEIVRKSGTEEVVFPKKLLAVMNLVPDYYGYYFIRPGIRQIFTHIIAIPAKSPVIRVTSCFFYNKMCKDNDKHTMRRIFDLPGYSKDPPV
jgi:hypothetical protein